MATVDSESRYAALAPDTRGHCSWFLTRTNKEHQATMEHPFMKTIYGQSFEEHAYVAYLAGQYLLFRELERLCEANQTIAPLSAIYDETLHRCASLERDLHFWAGEAWSDRCAVPSEATAKYLKMLQKDAGSPWLLMCHHFLNYNAVLSGGQYLGRMVASRAERNGKPSANDAGACFFSFPQQIGPPHGRVQQYIDAVDQLEISDVLKGSMLECMRGVYNLLLGMMDEVYSLAPVTGISYNESKGSASGGGGKGGKKTPAVPPPPLKPRDRKINLQEIHEHDGTRAKTLWTSVLGRVYDVSAGADLFGPGGPYEMFSGHDGTYNLAVMSLKKVSLDKFTYELDKDDKECLADWIAYFDNRYGVPIGELNDNRHPVGLHDLPAATKIPFSGLDDDDEEEEVAVETAPLTSKL